MQFRGIMLLCLMSFLLLKLTSAHITGCPVKLAIQPRTFFPWAMKNKTAAKPKLNLFCFLLIILSGDVEVNPGPVLEHKEVLLSLKNYQNCIKFLHLNCQSLNRKMKAIEKLIQEFGKILSLGSLKLGKRYRY